MTTYTGDYANRAFVKQAGHTLSKLNPNWEEIYNASPDQKSDTICIPDALDVLPNRRLETHRSFTSVFISEDGNIISESSESRREKQAFKRDMVGQRGEDKFFNTFRRLKIGGILIIKFNSEEFISKMNSKNMSNFDNHEWKKTLPRFECDAIFLHHQLGIFIIETQGCNNDGKVMKRVHKAAHQVEKTIRGIKEIYFKITGNSCPFDICGVICSPNAFSNIIHNKYKILGKVEIENENTFKKFWLPSEESQQRQILECRSREPITDDETSFIALIIGYRSAKFKFPASNIFEIYRIIQQQDFCRKKKKRQIMPTTFVDFKLQSLKTDSIFLNKDQLSALECTAQHVIISGPPGTGKTTVMLLRALKAAKLDKSGRVYIIAGIEDRSLYSLFRKIIDDNRSDLLRREIVISTITDILRDQRPFLSENDDIFGDEMPVNINILSATGFISLISDRRQERNLFNGTTTVVMTGGIYPHEVAHDMGKVMKCLPGFHHIELKTVVRGTRSIIDQWKPYYPDQFIILGHNVNGAPVEIIAVDDLIQLLTTVKQKVSSLLMDFLSPVHDTGDSFLTITPQHIAILVSNDFKYSPISHIKIHLNRSGFKCGDFDEQINHRDLIAIGNPLQALSFDWPVVIYVHTHDVDNSERLIAFSRCISNLIVIEEGGRNNEGTRGCGFPNF